MFSRQTPGNILSRGTPVWLGKTGDWSPVRDTTPWGRKKETQFSFTNKSFNTQCNKGKGSPYSITERRVPELIPVLGSQPTGDVSHKPGGRLPLLSARPAVIPATLKRATANFAACWTEAQWVWTVCLRLHITWQLRDCDLNPGLLRLSPVR